MQASHPSWNGSAASGRCEFRRWFRKGRNERNEPKKETIPWFRRGWDDQRWLGRAPGAPSVPPRLEYGPWMHSRMFRDWIDRKFVHASKDACNAHQAVTSVHMTSTRTVLVSRHPQTTRPSGLFSFSKDREPDRPPFQTELEPDLPKTPSNSFPPLAL